MARAIALGIILARAFTAEASQCGSYLTYRRLSALRDHLDW